MGHSVAVHGPIAEMRTHNAIGSGDGITDFILDRVGRVSCGSVRCRLLLLLRTLKVGRRVRQVGLARGVAPTYRALLEVPLQDITAGEGILAENTHVRSVTGV